MKKICQTFFAAALVVGFTSTVNAYTYSVINETTYPIYVEFHGHVMGLMMNGSKPKARYNEYKWPPKITYNEVTKTMTVDQAQRVHRDDTIVIEPGWRGQFLFKKGALGVCLNASHIKVGKVHSAPKVVQISRLPDDMINNLLNNMAEFSDALGQIGEGVAKVDDPRAQAAGAVIQGAAGSATAITKFIIGSTCKAITFVLVDENLGKQKEPSFKLYTSQLGG